MDFEVIDLKLVCLHSGIKVFRFRLDFRFVKCRNAKCYLVQQPNATLMHQANYDSTYLFYKFYIDPPTHSVIQTLLYVIAVFYQPYIM